MQRSSMVASLRQPWRYRSACRTYRAIANAGWLSLMVSVMLYPLLHSLEPFLVPICFVCAWVFILMMVMNLRASITSSIDRAKQMHQIPCPNCIFFTNNHRLKCPVNPKAAMSEAAIDCGDYREKTSYGSREDV